MVSVIFQFLSSCWKTHPISEVANFQPVEFSAIHSFVDVSETITIHCVEAGENKGDNIVILLHGFPDFWYTWKRQYLSLLNEGYFVITPDIRGFGGSSKPYDIKDYSAKTVSSDIEALRIHYCGEDGKFALIVGHDWGAITTWTALQIYPNLARAAVIMNVPHPSIMAAHIVKPIQMLKSWYVFYFQIPLVPEWFLKSPLARYCLISELESIIGSSFSDHDYQYYQKVLSIHDSVRGGLSYYRATACGYWESMRIVSPFIQSMFRILNGENVYNSFFDENIHHMVDNDYTQNKITIPLLILWGENDQYIGKELAQPPMNIVTNLVGIYYFDSGHWPHMGQSEAINKHLISFLNGEF